MSFSVKIEVESRGKMNAMKRKWRSLDVGSSAEMQRWGRPKTT